MSRSLINARTRALVRQNGRCWYCDHPLCLSHFSAFAKKHAISRRNAALLRVTAEHRVARQDGGKGGDNIVAACFWCNHHRHAGRPASVLSAVEYRALVRALMLEQRWFPWQPGSAIDAA